jgi:hypothetical protein
LAWNCYFGSSWGGLGLFREQLESPWLAKCKGRLARTNQTLAKRRIQNKKRKTQNKKYQRRNTPLSFGLELRFWKLLGLFGAVWKASG